MHAEIRFTHRETPWVGLDLFAIFDIKAFSKLQRLDLIQRKVDSVVTPIFTRAIRETFGNIGDAVKIVVMQNDQMVVLGHHQILLEEILKSLDALPEGQQVMLKQSLPVKSGLFDPLVDHPKVVRVVALSGGYKRPEACAELAKNRGIVASFSRALLEDLRAQMSEEEFNASLGGAIDEIYQGSTKKVAVAA